MFLCEIVYNGTRRGDHKVRDRTLKEQIENTYYTAAQARDVLGLNDDTFQGWVKAKKIKRIMLAGRKRGVYLKREVDAFVQSQEETVLSNKQAKLQFRRATVADIEAENHLAYLVFGEKANNAETQAARTRFLETNPDVTWHLYDDGVLVCSFNFVPLTHDAILQFREGVRGWLFSTENIEQFVPGKPLECIIIDFMTYPSVTLNKRRYYAGTLLHNFALVLEEWGAQGVEIASIHANGGTPDGRSILENAGFTFLQEKHSRKIYALSVAESDLSYLADYKNALGKYKSEHEA
jgi:hypothetical protein